MDILKSNCIAVNKALIVVFILVWCDMGVTYFALQHQMIKYPDSWRQKELSFVIGPLLRTFNFSLMTALIVGGIINSIMYVYVIGKIRTEFIYGITFGAIILALLSNTRVALM
jgi:hypothetical protein